MKIAKILIENGIDIDKERISEMPLLKAFSINKKFLLEDENIGKISFKEKEIFKTLMNSMCFGNINIAKFLLENGADINIKDDKSMTPLMWASSLGNKTMTKLLLENGAEIDFKESIIFSIKDMEILQLLIDFGLDINLRDTKGWTLLIDACFNDDIEKVEFLLKNGADVDIEDEEGMNALVFASNKDIDKLLYQYGIEYCSLFKKIQKEYPKQSSSNSNKSIDELKYELEITRQEYIKKHMKNYEQINLDFLEKYKTPMTKILETKDIKELKELIDLGYDTIFIDIYDLISLDYPIEFIELLLDNGNNSNIINKQKDETALLLAIKKDNLELVKLLIQYGADIKFKTESGKEIWEYAIFKPEIRDILLNPSSVVVIFQNPQIPSSQKQKLIHLF